MPGGGGPSYRPRSWAHRAPTSTCGPASRDMAQEKRPALHRAGGGPYLFLLMIRTCAAAMRPAGAVLCGSLPENVCRQVGSG